ncbi:DUF1573 domain-containing protein [Flavitalea sp. BT771]|uniref:DUF1573 domain-containing protein n=1 Tax=Flavitalea sp. BT771 TaxID=3063329 RepID=UPI0026E3B795|nr:DUF1573 domain-containing protein [Flavitalea sp. BT771]MDO6432306.1 DUF1573 domain-containing protein [Flavitalea sp. BT771]MDV6221216.1 DUF1573 domain-containing protein [Flavitalea sp. BT771]
MKPYHILLFTVFMLLFSFAFFSCNSKPSNVAISTLQKDKKLGEFSFEESTYNFGSIKDGDTVEHVFNYTNIGSAPLIIHDISTGCGCTVVDWPKNAIPVQGKGNIKVRFSKSHDPGLHTKTIIIKANTEDNYTVIHIEATVSK